MLDTFSNSLATVFADISIQLQESGLLLAKPTTNLLFPDNKLNLDHVMTSEAVDQECVCKREEAS